MTKEDIAQVIKQIPELNEFGIGLFNGGRGLSEREKTHALKEGQEALLDSADQCTAICEWLRQMEKIKTISRRCTSYGLKHVFERDTGRYVTNGAFICAAIHSGFDYKLIPGSPNVPFNISERSLNTVEKRLEGKRQ